MGTSGPTVWEKANVIMAGLALVVGAAAFALSLRATKIAEDQFRVSVRQVDPAIKLIGAERQTIGLHEDPSAQFYGVTLGNEGAGCVIESAELIVGLASGRDIEPIDWVEHYWSETTPRFNAKVLPLSLDNQKNVNFGFIMKLSPQQLLQMAVANGQVDTSRFKARLRVRLASGRVLLFGVGETGMELGDGLKDTVVEAVKQIDDIRAKKRDK